MKYKKLSSKKMIKIINTLFTNILQMTNNNKIITLKN